MIDQLLELLAIPSESRHTELMYNYLLELGTKEGWTMLVDKQWNLYATKGEAETYPCIVAHTDTVHRIEKGGITPLILEGKIFGMNPLTMEQTGIGGDDKCGIWAAIHCLRALPACKAVFFVDEEVGCRGSRSCDLAFFKDCRFILQADRRGHNDFVNRISGDPLSSDEFQEAVAPIMRDFGYSFSMGAMTDVMALRDDKVGISCANMSAGYHSPHSDHEYIVIQELDNVCGMMVRICREVTESYPFIHEPKKYTYMTTAGSGSNSSHWWDKLPSHAGTESHGDKFPDKFPDHQGSRYGMTVHCAYCSTPVNRLELIEDDPPACIDCALYKEEHGIWPVTAVGKMWRSLAGTFKGKKKRKKRKWQSQVQQGDIGNVGGGIVINGRAVMASGHPDMVWIRNPSAKDGWELVSIASLTEDKGNAPKTEVKHE